MGLGTGGVTGDPKFVSTDLTNANAFHPSAGAIDVGAQTAAYQDFAGTLRPAGAGWDIGAFEYSP